jgi:hypothetical protein
VEEWAKELGVEDLLEKIPKKMNPVKPFWL